jgi:hypothetical protein
MNITRRKPSIRNRLPTIQAKITELIEQENLNYDLALNHQEIAIAKLHQFSK